MKIDRMLAIILILLTRMKVTASELAGYFEVSVRTIYRDIESLSMTLISVAVRSEQLIEFSYQAREKTKGVRQVEPLRLIFLHRSWYLQAWCLLRKDYRLFKIARIKDLRVKARQFNRKFRMRDLPEASLRISASTTELDLLFTSAGAESVGELFKEFR